MAKKEKQPTTPKQKETPFRILSIDGGGIRGILPAMILAELERNAKPISERFDMIAGTSTGGILACILLAPSNENPTKPQYCANDALELYIENGDDIFEVPLWKKFRSLGGMIDEKYPSTGIETILARYLGDLRLSELLKPSLITAYDIARRETKFFTSHDALAKRRDFYLRDVARATSAAPTYFEVAQIFTVPNGKIPYPLIDGGMFANNPAMCAYAEVMSKYHNQNLPADSPFAKSKYGIQVLSLGTGEKKGHNYPYADAKNWGAAKWIIPALTIMGSASGEVAHYQLAQILEEGKNYFRIQIPLELADADMDNATEPNIINLQSDAQSWISKNTKLLNQIKALFS